MLKYENIKHFILYQHNYNIYIYIITYILKGQQVIKVIGRAVWVQRKFTHTWYFLLYDNIYSNTDAEQMYVIKESFIIYQYVKGKVELGQVSLSALFLLTNNLTILSISKMTPPKKKKHMSTILHVNIYTCFYL